jgi:hypothetical protein
VSGDYVKRLRALLMREPGIFSIQEERALRAALGELEQLRAENAILLDGNQRLQTMNDGLRQMAIQAREAAEGWHRATIDLYSGREEQHPPACPCGGQGTASRLAERDTATAACICGCGRPDDDTGMCHCPTPCPCEPDCAFCLAPNSVRNAERKAADDA